MGLLQGLGIYYAKDSVRTDRSSLTRSKKSSLVLFLLIVLIHSALIFYACKQTIKMRDAHFLEPQVNLILLAPEKTSSAVHEFALTPSEDSVSLSKIVIPAIEINETDLTTEGFRDAYELPNRNADKYKDVFDPKLRKKLQDLPPPIKTKPKIQYLDVGVTLEYIGNGMCLYGDAVHKTGYKVKCGIDQGEQMMMNVEHALADPLGLK